MRTGPFPGDNQRCKLTCVKGQWVGPLCRTKESKLIQYAKPEPEPSKYGLQKVDFPFKQKSFSRSR